VIRLDIPRLRLSNQRLSRLASGDPGGVVGWLGAVQSQDFTGAKWALGARLRSSSDARVERAFDEGTILRTHLLRPTWHFVLPADIRWLLDLTAPRIKTAMRYRHRQLELDARTFRRASAALKRALESAGAATRDELRQALRAAGIRSLGVERMTHIMMWAELDGLVCSGPRKGKQFTYALLDARAPRARPRARDEALAELAARYFASHGPATVQDFAKWAGLTVADARAGLEDVKSGLRGEVVERREYWFPPSRTARIESPHAHLLSIYDEYISGYKDRGAIVAPEDARRLVGMGNALTSVIAIDGRIVGTWKRRVSAREVSVEPRFFASPAASTRRAVKRAADRYGEFLGLPVDLR
jgi:hypothetical protein